MNTAYIPSVIPKVHGVVFILREYHADILRILQKRRQTHQEAADFLGISIGFFKKLLHLRRIPDFMTPEGEILEKRFREWTYGESVGQMFPGAFYSRQYTTRPMVSIATASYRNYMLYRKDGTVGTTSAPLLSFTKPVAQQPTKKTRKKNRKARF